MKYIVYDKQNRQWGTVPHAVRDIFCLPDVTPETILCTEDGRRTLSLAQALKEENGECGNTGDSELSACELLNLSRLPETCRLVRSVCRLVICTHVVALFCGIGAGVGGLFKHANPGLGAAIGAVAGGIVCAFVLKRLVKNEEV